MSVYRRGSRFWYSFIFNGRRIQRSTKSKNRKDARDIERGEWSKLARGEAGLPDNSQPSRTIKELLDALEATYEETSPQRRSLFKQARRAFGSKLASQLTAGDIETFIGEKRKAGKRPATINRVGELVRRSYRVAKITPPEIRHLSEKDNARKGFFADDEFRRVYSHLPENVRDFALFGYLTGWRKGEIASLTWNDIEEGVIRLRTENSKNREARSIVIAGELVDVIGRRKQARLANGVLTNLVFHRGGDPVAELRKSWATACEKAGVAGRIFHDLRRTAVRNMVRSGVPQSVAMKISGHKTASMFRRYDIASEADLRQAMQAVERYHNEQSSKVVTMGGNQ
jgi:integrase